MAGKEKVVVANASGFWGDEAAAVVRQVRAGPIDYLTMDYLAEITMIILARQKAQSEEAGYARDFVAHLTSVLDEVASRGITVIANAGGMNPGACARAVQRLLEERGLDLPIAVVDGDDLLPRLDELCEAGVRFEHLETGEPIGERLRLVNSANAYIGARPIVAALERGARIVITGRTYDAASVVAPLMFELGWDWEDFDRVAAALLAGHLAECGAQATGGNFTFWRDVPSYRDMGYPIIEAHADGHFVLTKHPNTGGLVDVRTATEQLLYEIGDPRAYVSPDVVADFTSFRLYDDGPNRVAVAGTRGSPPPDTLKVSMTYAAGYKLAAGVVVSGPDAVAKARTFADIYWGRVGNDGLDEWRTDYLGYSACWGPDAAPAIEPNEVLLRFAARASEERPLQRMARELAGIALAGPAGICGAGGRPQITPAYGYWPALIPRRYVVARTAIGGERIEVPCELGPTASLPRSRDDEPDPPPSSDGERVRVRLGEIAYSRSGDKGDACNIGVAAVRPELYPELVRELTSDRVRRFFGSIVRGPVERYRLDNLRALNFVLRNALGGGGTVSLLLDNQGKTFAQALLTMEIDVGRSLVERSR